MIIEIFIAGGFWFWALLGLEFVVLLSAVQKDRGFLFLGSLFVMALLLQLFGNVPIFSMIWQNPLYVIVVTMIYLGGGVLWVFPKWYFFVKNHHRRYIALRQRFMDLKTTGYKIGATVPDNLLADWDKYFYHQRVGKVDEEDIEFKPKVSDHKSLIITWMIVWPLSLPWTLINDPIIRFFEYIFAEIAGLLQDISDNVFMEK